VTMSVLQQQLLFLTYILIQWVSMSIGIQRQINECLGNPRT